MNLRQRSLAASDVIDKASACTEEGPGKDAGDPLHESAWLRKAGPESAPEIFRFLTLAILGLVCCAPMVSGKWLAVMESGA